MKPRHQVSRATVELIKSFEGFREHAARLPDGRWTIGFGHTKTARMGVRVSVTDAEMLLLYDLAEVSSAIDDWTFAPLNQNQFDALVSFAFNIGLASFRHSAVLRQINQGAVLQAACSLDLWRKSEFEGRHIVVDSLVRRRAAEKALFLTPIDGWTPAPSPVLRPQQDEEALAYALRSKPVALKASMVGQTASLFRDPDATEEPMFMDDAATAAADPEAAVADHAPAEGHPPVASNPLLFEAWTAAADPAPFQWASAPVAEATDATAEPELFQSAPEPEKEAELTHFEPEYAKPSRLTFIWLAAIGLAGLTIFAGAIVWGFTAKSSTGVINPVLLGGVIGMAGVVLIAVVVYSMLSKMGDRGE
jgi:lysozyme